jgi:hypothetical protein
MSAFKGVETFLLRGPFVLSLECVIRDRHQAWVLTPSNAEVGKAVVTALNLLHGSASGSVETWIYVSKLAALYSSRFVTMATGKNNENR